jgi:hypothetical protein
MGLVHPQFSEISGEDDRTPHVRGRLVGSDFTVNACD